MTKFFSRHKPSDYFFAVGQENFKNFFSYNSSNVELSYSDRIDLGGRSIYDDLKTLESFLGISATGDGFGCHFFLSESEKLSIYCRLGKITYISVSEFAFWNEKPICYFVHSTNVEQLFKIEACNKSLKDYLLFNLDKINLVTNEEAWTVPCFCCGKSMESSMHIEGKPQEGKCDPLSGGTSIVSHFGYGSIFDSDKFKIAICDICMLDSIMNSRVIEYVER